ncbi:helix-turn-helix domain-containing protein [Rhizobium leguminosarum]|uniref:Transcriptional regulator, Fis family n=1 Tax=Rhizobium leguminosarum bv. trifolii (strain WSM1325) TaxID=395491 RepID=C6AXB9_RHILS|nr:helix-turn-helix domain-containing protein [Rhizobium leguminosarum]ACS58043.1 transcriptional regulator, Fis family [Rhizobium leguminosarum bv. trifolii WSM1325]MBY2912244.1 sigma-54-dependent Fis family transcriptional regulator [Rhizobium leguminosarum]MBY2926800.1 sigma-54-dependent Fis family transcriptional regulator [Rhizobium leguminosarum]MBY2952157.1 sigma-54-dependent Fis family transcriptional regulator [Rhizobium leguminosarum]RWY64415.1 sigma-54-dependent Fis family transcrip
MHEHSAHAEHVYTSAQRDSAAASSPVVASWRRCMTMHQLAPEDQRAPLRLTDQEFRRAREQSEQLIASATEELDRLFTTVGRAGCCLLLTDKNGIALERRGAAGDDKEFRELGLWTGSVWTEASIGTNGIGTALADERAVAIFRDQHFFSSNTSLSCTTAPIRDHHGQVAAALDISACREDVNEMTLAILTQTVRDAAMRIELNLFRSAFAGARFLMVPAGANSAAALLAVDRHDLVLGATRAARIALQLDDKRIAAGIPAADALHEAGVSQQDEIVEAEKAALLRALSRAGGNVSQAAIALGISRATLHRKMKKLDLH